MAEHDATRCPLEKVDRRLEDAHRQWHAADDAYFDPDEFRRSIQGVIQTLRTVTFMLQSLKRDIPDFDQWYGGWQERLKADPLMRWMVEARNQIEKQGDLELHSFVRAEIIASYLDEGPRIEVPANLFDGISALLESLPAGKVGDHIKAHGILKVERRWVENTLADHELLEAVAVAFSTMAALVADAHRHLGLTAPATIDHRTNEEFKSEISCRPPCMIDHGTSRSIHINIGDGTVLRFEEQGLTVTRKQAEATAKRYGFNDAADILGKAGEPYEATLAALFKSARRVFKKDHYHQSVVFLFRDRRVIDVRGFRPGSPRDKYLMMRKLAADVQRMGGDAVMQLAEVWSAKYDPLEPYRRATDAPDKQEYLTADLVQRGGPAMHLSAEIRRKKQKVYLGPTVEADNPSLFAFAPILEAWGSSLPSEWAAGMATWPVETR